MRVIALLVVCLLMACAGGGLDAEPGVAAQGFLTVKLVDAPADVAALRVTVETLKLRACGGDSNASPWRDWDLGHREFDLLQLRNGAFARLLELVPIKAGRYCEARLVLAPNAKITMVGGDIYALQIPSADTSGFKIKGEFEVRATVRTLVTIDFDVDSSLHQAGRAAKYVLRPVLDITSVDYEPLPPSVPVNPSSTGTIDVGPAGNVINLGQGVSIEFPAGAVPVDTRFTWTSVEVPTPGFATRVFEFQPHMMFAVPPTVTLPVLPAAVTAVGKTWIHVDGQRLATTRNADTVSAVVPHFSNVYGMVSENVIVQESQAFCSGPSKYWHDDTEGSDGRMKWTYNNDAAIGVENACEYRLDLRSGRWELQVYIPADHATAHACYQIDTGIVSKRLVVDQKTVFGSWVSLGVFDANREAKIVLTDLTNDPRLATFVGFDAVRALPAEGKAVGTTLADCPVFGASTPAPPSAGKVELVLNDNHLNLDLRHAYYINPVDVIRFDSVAADALRAALRNNQNAAVSLYLALMFSGELSAFLAANGNIGDFLDILTKDPKVAIGEVLGDWGADALDVWGMIMSAVQAKALLANIEKSKGDLFLLIGQHNPHEISIPSLRPDGFVAVVDDLNPDTLRGFNLLSWFSDLVYFPPLDEEASRPKKCSLGKGIRQDFWTSTWTPVPNEWVPGWTIFTGTKCKERWCPPGYDYLLNRGWVEPVCQ